MTDTAREDEALQQEEKEVTITWAKDQDSARITSEIRGVTQALLEYDHFEENWRREQDGYVVAVSGSVPVGSLRLQPTVRQHGSHSEVVSREARDD